MYIEEILWETINLTRFSFPVVLPQMFGQEIISEDSFKVFTDMLLNVISHRSKTKEVVSITNLSIHLSTTLTISDSEIQRLSRDPF